MGGERDVRGERERENRPSVEYKSDFEWPMTVSGPEADQPTDLNIDTSASQHPIVDPKSECD